MKLNFYIILSIIVFNFIGCKTIPKANNDSIQKGLEYDKGTLFLETSPYLMPYNRIIDGVGTSVNFGNPDYENHSLDLVMIPNTDLVVVEDRFGIAVFNPKSKSLINRWEYRQNADYKNLMSSFSGIKAIIHKDSTYIFWGTGGREKSDSYVMQASWDGKEIKIIKAFPFKAIAPALVSLPNEVFVKEENNELYLYTVLNGNNQLIKSKVSNMEQVWALPTGICPYGLCEVDDKIFVSNWAGPVTNPNDGLETAGIPWGSAYIDPKTGAMSRGTVSVIEAKTGKFIKEIEVGLHPNAIISSKDGQNVFVANGNSDNISVIDIKKLEVVDSIFVGLFHENKNLIGSSPNALALDETGKTLFVANGLDNAIAVILLKNYIDNQTLTKNIVKGFIPTQAYPSGIVINKEEMYITNLEAIGARAEHKVNDVAKAEKAYNAHKQLASVSFIPLPNDELLNNYTEKVKNQNLYY